MGQPNIETIVDIFWQLKMNLQRVPTTLGGGQLGYLTLLLSSSDYNTIPGSVNFIRPIDPGMFIPVNPRGICTWTALTKPITAVEIAAQRLKHDNQKHLYNEVQALETALRNQVIEAINRKYLEPLHNITTDMINDSIPDNFAFLRMNYDRITPGQLKHRESAIDTLTYNPSTNVDTIFNKIQIF